MTDLIIIGTIGLDDVKTPFGQVKAELGGSGSYASCAAAYFGKPGLISIAGTDLPQSKIDLLKKHGVNLAGVERKGKNFRWSGTYEFDMNSATTLKTDLNSLADFNPVLPDEYRSAKFVFLANVDPILQLKVIQQLPFSTRGVENRLSQRPFIVVDTMNYWIESKRKELTRVITKSDLVVMNEGEARELFKTPNLIKAGKLMLQLGPKFAIIKKGEHGALLFSENDFFSAPGYPMEEVRDPTGAGDSFAGALIGYLASLYPPPARGGVRGGGRESIDIKESDVRKAVVYGSAVASFCAEQFSLGYLDNIKIENIKERYNAFKKIRQF